MKLPDNVSAQLASIIAAVGQDVVATEEQNHDGAAALLPIALEILSREFGAFVLFCRLGDHVPVPIGTRSSAAGVISPRAYGVIAEGADQADRDLVKNVREWLEEKATS